MRNYHRGLNPPRCTMKIDLLKAYDTVSWDFLFKLLDHLGFPSIFVGWVMECCTTTRFSISMDGYLHGFFEGRRGLRQGDPLSPYLFLLIMDTFSCIMDKASSDPAFSFHPRCKEIGLHHLCFADDLIILCGGDFASCSVAKKVIVDFCSISGLLPNPNKSCFYSSGIDEGGIMQIGSMLGFVHSRPPFQYLGVPLITTRLKSEDCKRLIDRITAKIKCWTNRFLSYAGRLQLIKSVLFGIQVYWSSLFILPKRVILSIEQLMKDFLWTGPELKHSGATVAWKDLCCTNKEGGLGIKNIERWNEAAIMKLLWNLSSKKDGLWVKWCNVYKLKRRSLWAIDIANDCTWSWRKMMQLRQFTRPFIKSIIGDGSGTFLWHDNWHPLGPLHPLYGDRVIYDAASNHKALVADFITENGWRWPSTITVELLEIRNAELPGIRLDTTDEVVWVPRPRGFTISSAYEALSPGLPPTTWHNLVWN